MNIRHTLVSLLLIGWATAGMAQVTLPHTNASDFLKGTENNVILDDMLPTIVTSLVDATACEDVEFDADIAVTNFTNVGSVSLALNYDTSQLTFLGYENLNSAMEGGSLFVSARNGVVYVSWMSLGGATIGDGILMSLKFSGISGSSTLTWYTSRCEYANVLGMVFPDMYQSGTVAIYSAPYIVSHPVNQDVIMGESTSFSIEAEGQNLAFQWYVSEDEGTSWMALEEDMLYAGVNTEMLLVNATTFNMNGYLYRCEVDSSCGLEYSNSALLSVGITQTFTLSQGWSWWSTYIEADDLLNQLKASLGTNGMSINTQGAVLVYRNGMWMGGMSSIENKKGYKIRTSAPVEVTIEGQVVDPVNCPITITQGANWIGYPLPVSQTVGNALAGFTPSNGDVIMTQGGTTLYRSGHWMPATFTFEPGKGYVYKSTSSTPKTLIFLNGK